MGKAIGYLVALVAGVAVVGWAVGWFVSSVLGPLLFYMLLGALVVTGGVLVYSKMKKGLAPGTRTQRRIEAAARTYRMRNR
ncbi:hypothetical protein [Actinoplanes sp. NPDC049802]|uniref:hypothetical protein n=1 Tax=Actinoplanes sp. NPDC049802 TaxID=3154742 RepID=UPI0033C9AFEF